ncbi:MAG TPA: hypothetical protein PKI11_18985 [Candidatus Hydrogenedentes bacterium]|nr:hypothetical protein [Candidatus Hydrogenedentota bacterium]HNT89482.1 hypothetical protein [Candidatus Hydrogenedentota bacterium]
MSDSDTAHAPSGTRSWRSLAGSAGRALIALWTFGCAAFFFVRFSFLVHHANQDALRQFIERWLK